MPFESEIYFVTFGPEKATEIRWVTFIQHLQVCMTIDETIRNLNPLACSMPNIKDRSYAKYSTNSTAKWKLWVNALTWSETDKSQDLIQFSRQDYTNPYEFVYSP